MVVSVDPEVDVVVLNSLVVAVGLQVEAGKALLKILMVSAEFHFVAMKILRMDPVTALWIVNLNLLVGSVDPQVDVVALNLLVVAIVFQVEAGKGFLKILTASAEFHFVFVKVLRISPVAVL